MVGVQQLDRVVEVVEETLKGRGEQIIVVRKRGVKNIGAHFEMTDLFKIFLTGTLIFRAN